MKTIVKKKTKTKYKQKMFDILNRTQKVAIVIDGTF